MLFHHRPSKLTPADSEVATDGRLHASVSLHGDIPLTGESFFLELPALNATHFQLFLHEFAVTDPASLLVLVLDNGRAHKAAMLTIPANVPLLFLSSYAPEFNPIERLWRALKDALAEAGEPPKTLETLSEQIATLIKDPPPQEIQLLTSYHYFMQAA